MLRLSHILTTAALVAVCAAPASAATFEQLDSDSSKSQGQAYVLNRDYGSPDRIDAASKSQGQAYVLNRDYGSPDRIDAASKSQGQAYVLNRDYGSPDAADAAPQPADRGAYALNRDYGSPDAADAAPQPADRGAYALNRDYGSPDAADAARNLPPVQIPVVEARDVPSSGFDWGDAGIGAAGMLALFSIAAGSALLLAGRRRGHGIA